MGSAIPVDGCREREAEEGSLILLASDHLFLRFVRRLSKEGAAVTKAVRRLSLQQRRRLWVSGSTLNVVLLFWFLWFCCFRLFL